MPAWRDNSGLQEGIRKTQAQDKLHGLRERDLQRLAFFPVLAAQPTTLRLGSDRVLTERMAAFENALNTWQTWDIAHCATSPFIAWCW